MRLILGLGGNLDDPPAAFQGALDALGRFVRVVTVSSLYRSDPIGPPQPRYWNMAALLEIAVPPVELLDRCQELEAAAGRDRSREVLWGPRPLDLDLLLAEGIIVLGARLILPHPRLLERPFALVPAAEAAPDLLHPLADRTLAELAAGPHPGLVRVGPLHG